MGAALRRAADGGAGVGSDFGSARSGANRIRTALAVSESADCGRGRRRQRVQRRRGAADRLHDDRRVESPRGYPSWLERAAVSVRQRLRVVPGIRQRAIEQRAVRGAIQPVGEPVQAVHRRRAPAHAGSPRSRDGRPRAPHRPRARQRLRLRAVAAHGADGRRSGSTRHATKRESVSAASRWTRR